MSHWVRYLDPFESCFCPLQSNLLDLLELWSWLELPLGCSESRKSRFQLAKTIRKIDYLIKEKC